MNFSSCICIIIVYYIMYEDCHFLYPNAQKIQSNKNNQFFNNDINLINEKKYISSVNGNNFFKKGRSVENFENNNIIKFPRNTKYNPKNLTVLNPNKCGQNFLNENMYYNSMFPQRNIDPSPNVLQKNSLSVNTSSIDNGHSQNNMNMGSLNLRSFKNLDATLYEYKKDLFSNNPSNTISDILRSVEEITDKSSFYEANLYMNSVNKPSSNFILQNIKSNDDKNFSSEIPSNNDHLRIYRSKNIEIPDEDEEKSISDTPFNQDVMLAGLNQPEKPNNKINENNSLSPLQNSNTNNNVFENVLNNFNQKVLPNNAPLPLPSDFSFNSNNNFKRQMINPNNSSLLNVKNITVGDLSGTRKNNTDQIRNITNDVSSRNLKFSENFTNRINYGLSNKNTLEDRQQLKNNNYYKLNSNDLKSNENYENFFQQLQENLTRLNLLKPIHTCNTISDYDFNKYRTGSIRPQILLQDEGQANLNLRNLMGDNISRHNDDNDLLEYLTNDNEKNHNRITKNHFNNREINNVTNSSGNLRTALLPFDGEKIPTSDISRLSAGAVGGSNSHSCSRTQSEVKLGGFLSQPPTNTKVNIKDPKLIQNLRKIDISLLSFPPAFNYGLPINKPKKGSLQKVNRRSIPITLQFANESSVRNLKNATIINDNNQIPINLSAELLPSIILRPDQIDKDTYQALTGSLLNLNASKSLYENDEENYVIPKYFDLTTNGRGYFKEKPILKTYTPTLSKLNRINILKNWNFIPSAVIENNLTQPVNDFNNSAIKLTDLEEGLKQLASVTSADVTESAIDIMKLLIPKVNHQSYKDKDNLAQMNMYKTKYFKNNEEYSGNSNNFEVFKNNSSNIDFLTKSNGKKLFTDAVEFKQQMTEMKNRINRNSSTDTLNNLLHVNLLGFVLEKNNSDNMSDLEKSKSQSISLKNQNFKFLTTFDPLRNEIIAEKLISNLTKSKECLNIENKHSTPCYLKVSTPADLSNIIDATLLQRLLSLMQKNLEKQLRKVTDGK